MEPTVGNADPRWTQLRAAFSAELADRVRTLNQLLLAFERPIQDDGEKRATLDGLFREAHSLKGAARAVELPHVEELAHVLETVLDQIRETGQRPDGRWFDAVYHAVDILGESGSAADQGNGSSPPSVTETIAVLNQVLKPSVTPETAPAVIDSVRAEPPHSLTTPVAGQAINGSSRVQEPASSSPVSPGSVRVAVDKLDSLLAQAGELAVNQIRVEQRLKELQLVRSNLEHWRRECRGSRSLRARLRSDGRHVGPMQSSRSRDLDDAFRFIERAESQAQDILLQVAELAVSFRHDAMQLGLVTHAIEDDVMAVRLVPLTTIVGPFERMVRDLTRETGKEARLVVEGGETEIDRRIAEQLRDPLMHMLRNAIDHGIETPDARVEAGKARSGTICLKASQRGSQIEISLSDDGIGLNPEVLRASAIRKGLYTEEQAAALDDRAAVELIFQPGFSTNVNVTQTSGRGVGMDVVREHVGRLSGQVEAVSVPGRGATVTLTVPLTLATTRAILVEHNDLMFAVPSGMVERTLRIREDELGTIERRRVMQLDGRAVPVVDLGGILELRRTVAAEVRADEWRPVFVLRQGDRRVAFLADRLVGEQEIVVKNLHWPLQRVRNVSGAAVLGSGRVVIILNPADLLKSALQSPSRGSDAFEVNSAPAARKRRVLVVDDSVTTRTLERTIVEAAGYDVTTAMDGIEALNVLRDQSVDLVVSDVNMPRLDGFDLTVAIRRDEKLQAIPVILVTSLDDLQNRERGAEAGADAYIVKSAFDQVSLIETIGRLIS